MSTTTDSDTASGVNRRPLSRRRTPHDEAVVQAEVRLIVHALAPAVSPVTAVDNGAIEHAGPGEIPPAGPWW